MVSPAGRLLRIVVGIALIAWGLCMHSTAGFIAVVGVVPFAAGLFDWYLFAPLMHMPFTGKAIRTCEPNK